MTMPSMDTMLLIAFVILGLAILYAVVTRLRSPVTVQAPAPQPIAPVQPTYYADAPAPEPYSLLLAYHDMVTRDANVLAAQRVYYNAVGGRSVGREADMTTTFAPPPTAIPLPAPAPPPTIEPPTAATASKARTTAKRAAK